MATITRVSTAADGTQGNAGAINQPPTANPDTYGTQKAKQLTVDAAHGVLANDTDVDSPVLTAELVGGPAHARSFALAADGSFDYRPVASFSGTDSFTYMANDGQADSAPATVTIDVTSPGASPAESGLILVSSAADGTPGNAGSSNAGFSPDGSKIAFTSGASNLVAGDTNNALDVFVKDLSTGAVTRVSTAADGTQRDSDAFLPVFSPDGSKIAFEDVKDLANNDIQRDIFVKDLASGALTQVSTAADGARIIGLSANPAFSPDGRSIAFQATTAGPFSPFGIFVKNLASGALTLVSTAADGTEGNNTSQLPAFSPDGRKIAFDSFASNLVAGDTNNANGIFVKDLATGAVTRVDTAADGTQANGQASLSFVFSPDGRKIAFESDATNLVAGDTNGQADIFVKNLATGAVTRVDTAADGTQANGQSFSFVFSPNGRKIAFTSNASNLVAGDTNGQADIFVKDLVSGAVTRVSVAADGVQANGGSDNPVFSPDGRKIAFISDASNLVAGDTNGVNDVFVKDLVSGAVTRVSIAAGGVQANGASFLNLGHAQEAFSPDGRKIVFDSLASNLVAGDTNAASDIFVATLTSQNHPPILAGHA
jgi:Tol biopolymer transport system component